MAMLKAALTTNDHICGQPQAPITIVAYSNFQCTHCAEFYGIVKQLQRHLRQDLLYAFRHFCTVNNHPLAEVAAETAEFAASYDRFWEMHDLLFTTQERLSMATLIGLCQRLQLPTDELEDVLNNRIYIQKIRQDLRGGVESGVKATPTLFINGRLYYGRIKYESILRAIELAAING